MLWKQKGVEHGSYMCFFNPPDQMKEYFYYMVSCGYFQCNAQYLIRNRGTRPPLFCYVISGTLQLIYEEVSYSAPAGSIVLMNCYRSHQYSCEKNCEFLFFHFDGNNSQALTNYLIDYNGSPVFNLSNAQDIYKNINEPIMKLCYQEQTTDAFLSSLVYSTLCFMQAHNESPFTTHLSLSDMVMDIIDYIKGHIAQELSLQILADRANLSIYYFSHLFKKETGYAPMEYVSITRINYAKLMLRTTNKTAGEIGEMLQYSSTSSFINAFRHRCGLSPNQYRKQTEKIWQE